MSIYIDNIKECKELDALLQKIKDAPQLFSVDVSQNTAEVKMIKQLCGFGLIDGMPDTNPTANKSVFYYKVTTEGAKFAGFEKTRLEKIAERDEKAAQKENERKNNFYKKWEFWAGVIVVIVSVTSLIISILK